MADGPAPENPGQVYVVDLGERVRLMRDSLINNSNLLISAPVGIILVPIMLKALGAEGYGLWVAALAVGSMVTVDLGILNSVARAVAGQGADAASQEMPRFVGSAWRTYQVLGLFGALGIGVFGFGLTQGLHLSPQTIKIAPLVFGLAGLAYWGNQLLTFTIAVLNGLRRFDVANFIAVGTTLFSAAGVIAVFRFGGSLLAIAVWQVILSWIVLLVALYLVRRLEPRIRLGQGKFKWAWLRPYFTFGLWSQMADFAENSNPQIAPLLIGTVLSSSAISPFAVGQKFPMALARIQGRAMDVLFPAASQSEHTKDSGVTRQLIEVGTRWTIVLMLPLYLGLILAAPNLLLAWMGEAPPETVAVLRLLCASMAVSALGGGAEQVLWGRGEARKVFWVSLAALAANLGVTYFTLHRIGLEGAAWGLLSSMTLRSAAYLVLGSRRGQTGVFHLLRVSLEGIFLPGLACGAATFGVLYIGRPGRWLELIAAALAGGLAYGIGLYFGGARTEERMLAGEVLFSPFTLTKSGWKHLRQAIIRLGSRYNSFPIFSSIYRVLTYKPEHETARIEQVFTDKVDPYGALDPEEQERFSYELAMLDAVRDGTKFERALEIGCGEGVFTELVSTRCKLLVAVDNSDTALERARNRCRQIEFVEFFRFDMRRDPLPGTFDLIVVTALSNLVLPREYRYICTAMVNALRPGGYLLVGDLRGPEVYDKSWLGKRLFLGGKWILGHINNNSALRKVGEYNLDIWMHTLFRKV